MWIIVTHTNDQEENQTMDIEVLVDGLCTEAQLQNLAPPGWKVNVSLWSDGQYSDKIRIIQEEPLRRIFTLPLKEERL